MEVSSLGIRTLTMVSDPGRFRLSFPFRSVYTMIRCHAEVSHLYKTVFQAVQKGRIGITLSADWVEPIDSSEQAKEMAQRKLDFFLGVVRLRRESSRRTW